MTESDIKKRLRIMTHFHGIFVDEFTFHEHRIDAIIIDLKHRWIRGFEIKTNRSDFNRDIKWTQYSKFLSSLSMVCPEGLIQPNEIEKPLGLLWITENGVRWKKRPGNFQNRHSLAWLWTYVSVIEAEFPRIIWEKERMFQELRNLRKQLEAREQ